MAHNPGDLPHEDPPGSGMWFWADGSAVTEAEKAELFSQAQGGAPTPGSGINTGVQGYTDIQNLTGGVPLSQQPGASLDTSQADLIRERQQDFIRQLQQQATTGDGAWRQSFQDAVRRSMATASAVGQSNPNAGYQSSLRNIGNAQSAVSQRAVGEEQMLREQSKLDAQDQLGGMLGSMGQMDAAQAAEAARVNQARRVADVQRQGQARDNTMQMVSGIAQAVPYVGQALGSAAEGMSDGGQVPGQPKVFGDDSANDTVPAMLSPKEIVIPISIAQRPDAPEAAARFVAAVKAQGGSKGYADGGSIPGLGIPTEDPSIQNGGQLDTTQFDQTAGQQQQLADLFSGRAQGSGPSIANVQLQQRSDADIAAAMGARARGGPGSADIMSMLAASGAKTAGDVGKQRGIEQSQGQSAYALAVQQQRAQQLAMSQAKQNAAWQNTMLNSGINLQNQALIKDIMSAGGQGLAALASSSRRGGGGGGDEGDDTAYEDDEIEENDDDFAFGGVVGLSEGGYPRMPKPKDRTRVEMKMGALQMAQMAPERSEYERFADDEELETGDRPTEAQFEAHKAKKAKKPEEPSAFARAVRGAGDFVKKTASSVRGMAEGGGVPDDGGTSYAMFPFIDPPRPAPVGERRTFTGAELGLGGGFSPAAKVELPAIKSGPQGMKVAPPAEKVTVQVGETPSGQPVLEQREGFVQNPIPGLRKKETAPPPEAPKPAPKPKGPGTPPLDAEATSAEQAAVAAKTAADAATAGAHVQAAADKANAIESALNERKRIEATAKQRSEEAMARYQAARDEMSRIDTAVDPGRFWATRSTGDKVLGIIGLVLGALGTGPDGINRAAVMMNQAIDRDLDAQKAEHEMRLKKGAANVDAAQTYYSMARNISQDELAAADLARASALDAAAAKADQLIASTGNAQAKAQGQMLSATLRRASADRQAAAFNKMADRQLEREKIEASKTKGGAAKEVREAAQSYVTMRGTVDELKGLIGDTNVVTEKVGDKAARMETLAADLLLQVKEAGKLGALDKGSVELAEKLIGDPTATFTLDSTKIAKLEQLVKQAERQVQSARAVVP